MKIVNDDDTQGKYTMNILRVVLLGDCEIPFCGWMDDVFQVKFILFSIRWQRCDPECSKCDSNLKRFTKITFLC